MANQTLDFSKLNQTNISGPNFDIDTYNLQSFFYPYSLYVEERTSDDVPKDSKANLYNLYDAGINNIGEDNWKITIGEDISSHTQIYCTNNYSTVTSNFLTTSGDFNKIHYDDLISYLSGLEDIEDENKMSAKVMDWINDYVNDFSINRNPENADDSNLILTHELKSDIKNITERILNKVFRNLVQLIRFKRDYRMYGPGSTIYGNCYENDISCQNYTAIPASCFTQRTNHYIVGKKAYNDEITSVDDGTIQNSVWHISPHKSYAIAKHAHTVTVDIGKLPNSVRAAHDLVTEINVDNRYYAARTDKSTGTSWEEQTNAKGGHVLGICDIETDKVAYISSAAEYSYSWSSNNSSYCRLMTDSSWGDNPWTNSDLILPTYSTRVWTWSHDDTATDINNPTKYM